MVYVNREYTFIKNTLRWSDKELKDIIYKPLTMIFKQSFDDKELPLVWKTANVKALYKKVNRSDPGN